MEEKEMKIQIIIGSTRPGRVSDRVAKWVANEAKNLPDVEVEVVDLADYNLPFFDELISPQYNPNRTPNPAARKWLAKVAEADAYVLATPEYNRSYPAVLKNALDYVDFQMERKPVALAAHGTSGGAQATAHLRSVLAGLLAVTIPKHTLIIGRAAEYLDESGTWSPEVNPAGPPMALKAMLTDLKWYGEALASARAQS
jgi:NAD(P)H-dependent FMN reductase